VLRPRFFTSRALPAQGGELLLEAEPSRHIARTLRMQQGDCLCLFDGSGREARGLITAVGRSEVTVRVDAPQCCDRESPLDTTLAVAVSRGERMDTVIQKATELGVHRIRPVLSERVGVKLDSARWHRKLEHWQRIAVSACEQCGRNRVPDITEPQSLTAFLQQPGDPPGALRLLLHPAQGAAAIPEQCRALLLLVGPEGGFSAAEVDAATGSGFVALQLGPRILRTETAPLAALTWAQLRWGDLAG
jgi:16S rRNA (uracil1498-N3)-methyltransferase